MRIIDIAIYLMVFNISLFMLNAMIAFTPTDEDINGLTRINGLKYLNSSKVQVFGMDWLVDNSKSFGDAIQEKGKDVGGSDVDIQQVFSWFNIIWKGFVLVISTVLVLISTIISGVSSTINNFFPNNLLVQTIGYFLQLIVWFIYGIGFSQWIGGRGFKEYQ